MRDSLVQANYSRCAERRIRRVLTKDFFQNETTKTLEKIDLFNLTADFLLFPADLRIDYKLPAIFLFHFWLQPL